jgi:hypothetical protein
MGLRHTPTTSFGFSRTHCTFFPEVGRLLSLPQQSASVWQMSPSMWQPLARWHTDAPLVPYGAHTRLQQSLQVLQTVPSTPPLQRVLPGWGVSQRPSVAPAATLQTPPQQSRGFEQTSPSCAHHDEPRSQTPALQSLEQHSALEAQALPAVRQEPLKGWHLPAEQLPPQHSLLLAHAPLSETHALPSQTPPLH